jgi:glycosyltransferase involved in cell wall biosynthesis
LLLQAIYALKQTQVRCELVMVGDGPMRADLESAISRLGIADRVHLAGPLGEDDVRREILKSRAMVLPSFAEGLPVVLMEALALYRPVVSTYVAGIPELVVPGTCGWLVPAGSVEALAGALRDCLEASVEQLGEMGKNGYELVRDRHSAAKEASTLRELFQNAIGTESNGSLRSSARVPTMAAERSQGSQRQIQ